MWRWFAGIETFLSERNAEPGVSRSNFHEGRNDKHDTPPLMRAARVTARLAHSPMAEAELSEQRRFRVFFLYDRSKVQEEADLTRAGICYFYPEDTPLEQQELLCGQLAGVSRCVAELSASPVRLLRLRKSKYAVRMRDNFLWALSCVAEIPDISVCEFLDQLVDLFCFYNGPVRQSYQLRTRGELALRWTRYLSHLQGGSTELHHIFSCLKTVDSTHIDPLLLLKAALILQACQRCPLVLAGCLLYRSRVLSTQMPPQLTRKVMVHETETYSQEHRLLANETCLSGATPTSGIVTTTVFLSSCELDTLRCPQVDDSCRFHCTPQPPSQPRKTCRLSRTLSDTTHLDPAELDSAYSPPPPYQTTSSSPHSSLSDEASFSLCSSTVSTPLHSTMISQSERSPSKTHDHSLLNGMLPYKVTESMCDGGISVRPKEEERLRFGSCAAEPLMVQCAEQNQTSTTSSGSASEHQSPALHTQGQGEEVREEVIGVTEVRRSVREEVPENWRSEKCQNLSDAALEPVLLYQHRVGGLVLALLVEQLFNTHTSAKQDVYFSSLASMNGLEAHLRTGLAGPAGPQGPYAFTHYDCIQNTLTMNVSAGSQDAFVKATALLHSHFSHIDTLQEAIVRNASGAVYANRSAAQETYFLQQGASARNSGIPNVQDSAFSLPSKARHRLLKHGVNLL